MSLDGRESLEFPLPANVLPRTHRAVILSEEKPLDTQTPRGRPRFTAHPVGPIPADSTYRREGIHGDDGRRCRLH
jgi:hypothetical protein